MGLFDFFKKEEKLQNNGAQQAFYELLFCDNADLYKEIIRQPELYPWNILFSESQHEEDLLKIIADKSTESKVKLLAYRQLEAVGMKSEKQELLAVIVEVGLENGLDVLASYRDGTARYINQTGKILVWETPDAGSDKLTDDLFEKSARIVDQISAWNEPRKPRPVRGDLRISFLASDELYLGEGPIHTLFSDPMAGPALQSATALMDYLTARVLAEEK